MSNGKWGGEVMRENVHRGAMVLDRVVPGWATRLKLERLDMVDINLCVLGQLFGRDVETSIAQEMYPELWAKGMGSTGSGYGVGLHMIPELVGQRGYRLSASNPDPDLQRLAAACAGADNRCFWAEEVAARLTKEEEIKDGTTV